MTSLESHFFGNGAALAMCVKLEGAADVNAHPGALADHIHNAVQGTTSPNIEETQQLMSDAARFGILSLPYSFPSARININNQCKFPVFQVDFGTGAPGVHMSQWLCDTILIVPCAPPRADADSRTTAAADAMAGGVDVYLSAVKDVHLLLEPHWQARLRTFSCFE